MSLGHSEGTFQGERGCGEEVLETWEERKCVERQGPEKSLMGGGKLRMWGLSLQVRSNKTRYAETEKERKDQNRDGRA